MVPPATVPSHPVAADQASRQSSPTPERGIVYRWVRRGAAFRGTGRDSLISRVLAARGLDGAAGDEIARFLGPSLSHLHDPSLMPDLDRAALRILDAVKADRAIVIYGDYDVDGITASAILFHMIRAIAPGARVQTYTPHRIDEGYGLNAEALQRLAGDGAGLIISVDCGVTALDAAAALRSAHPDVDLIVTDHHEPPHSRDRRAWPAAYAIVHPLKPDFDRPESSAPYPFAELCGAGVAFKLAWRLATLAGGSQRVGESMRTLLLDLLALASLGVIADVVPLRGENRVMARFGLARLKSCDNPGLRALIAASGLGGDQVRAEDVGFKLGPRLNACGRMGHAREAIELLTTAQGARAREIAESLSGLNEQRRAVERRIFEQADELALEAGMTGPDCRAIVLAHPQWHQGVVGIVCSRLVERYHRPVILMQEGADDDAGGAGAVCHGSGRSIDGFNLHAALEACRERLVRFGGHEMAAGLKLLRRDLDEFRSRFIEHCAAKLTPDDLVPTRQYDCDAGLGELNEAELRELERLAPFGRENPSVTLCVRGVRVLGYPETMGSGNKHMVLRVADRQSGAALRVVGWGWGERLAQIPHGAAIDMLVQPKVNSWGGRTRVEGELVDVRITAS